MGMNWTALYSTIMVLDLEYIPSTKRSLAPVTRALGMSLSGAIMPWLLKFLDDWKIFHQIIYAVPLFVLITPLAMHESVRWLLIKGKVDRAFKVIRVICKVNGQTINEDKLTKSIEVEAENLQAASGKSTHFFSL